MGAVSAFILRNAVLIDIHGGFYVAGQKECNKDFVSVFLKEGFDIVLVEYRLNDGVRDVADQLKDCASALDYITIHADEHIHEPITLFGSLVSTYTYEYIVSDKLTNQAKRFKERYDRSTMNIQQGNSDRFDDILSWEGERKDLMQLSDEYKGFSPTFSGVMRLRRIQRQNQENCFHLFTKRMLAKAALGNKALQLLNVNELSRKKNETTYTCQNHEADPAVTRVLDVLAQTEHLRWIASHEILGYREGDDEEMKDETRLLHGCLKPWQELSTIIKSYDYNVVDVSLGISMEPESNEDL